MPPRLVVDARLLHYNQAGIGRYLRHLYRAMAARGGSAAESGAGVTAPTCSFDVTMLYSRKDSERLLQAVWPVSTAAWTPAHHRLERWTLGAEVARLRPDVLHSPDHVTPQPFGWRSVVTVHDLAFGLLPESHTPESRAYYAGLERSVRQAARIICVSEATRQALLNLAPDCAQKSRVVYEAPDPAFAPEGPVFCQDRPYLVFTGTIVPRKNVGGIIRALAPIPPSRRPQLRIIGAPGAAYAEVAALVAALGLERDVVMLGHLPTDQVAAHYRGALALVYPSFLEGFGLPILEAMVCGAPVITSGCSSMVEVAGGAALLVDPHDPTSIAAAIDRVTTDAGARRSLIERGRVRAAQFSWERAARETCAVFQEALG